MSFYANFCTQYCAWTNTHITNTAPVSCAYHFEQTCSFSPLLSLHSKCKFLSLTPTPNLSVSLLLSPLLSLSPCLTTNNKKSLVRENQQTPMKIMLLSHSPWVSHHQSLLFLDLHSKQGRRGLQDVTQPSTKMYHNLTHGPLPKEPQYIH